MSVKKRRKKEGFHAGLPEEEEELLVWRLTSSTCSTVHKNCKQKNPEEESMVGIQPKPRGKIDDVCVLFLFQRGVFFSSQQKVLSANLEGVRRNRSNETILRSKFNQKGR